MKMLKKIIPFILVSIFCVSLSSQSKDSLYFCKDYKDTKEVGVAKVFTLPKTGGDLTVMVRLGDPIGVDHVNLEIYKITGGDEVLIRTDPWDINKDWDYIYFSYVNFKQEGKFRVACTRKNGLEVVSGYVEIKFEKE